MRLLVVLILGCLYIVASRNPIVPDVGLCDPHVHIYGQDRAYLYGTHDFAANNTGYKMQNWWVWSSDDLVSWTLEDVLTPEETCVGKAFDSCWATDSAYRPDLGLYFFYFSIGGDQIGVVSGPTPVGPWKDPLGKPLIARGLVPTQSRDPSVFIDEDGSAYIVWGTFDYFIAKLSHDMISLAETPKALQFDRKFGPYGEGKLDDKPFLHKHNGMYYLSWGCFYATSSSVYGPWHYRDSFVQPQEIEPSFTSGHPFMDRHGSFFTLHGQTYFACNDYSQKGTSAYFRESIISYVHYKSNGDIAPLVINSIGVGQYDASSVIEAENYFKISNGFKCEMPGGGFGVCGMQNASILTFSKVSGVPASFVCTFNYSSAVSGGPVLIELGTTLPIGKPLCSVQIEKTSSWDEYGQVDCVGNLLDGLSSNPMDISISVATSVPEEVLRVNWFQFQTQ
eukprot:TRINITY_DN32701_c0_g1_i1.p1 TRINITY_DN32701_c0_g1~~TRINITY_DN32701_c0_g1_i1.p1  ORF type:complete len:450 (+),score=102.13 TRINITY_DN32701_c0_g1_i1:17-1366(+)